MHIYVGYEDAADKKYFYRAIAEIKKLDPPSSNEQECYRYIEGWFSIRANFLCKKSNTLSRKQSNASLPKSRP